MFQELLKKLAEALDKQGIAYMVIGGQAVLLYGEPRLTKDIDVTLGIGPDGLSELLKVVNELAWQVLVDQPEDFVHQTLVLPCRDSATTIRVDFIFSFSPYEQQALQRVRKVALDNVQVKFAAKEDIIIHKLVAGRPRDLEDVSTILIKNPSVDQVYIRNWLNQFEASLSRPFWEQFEELWKNANK